MGYPSVGGDVFPRDGSQGYSEALVSRYHPEGHSQMAMFFLVTFDNCGQFWLFKDHVHCPL